MKTYPALDETAQRVLNSTPGAVACDVTCPYFRRDRQHGQVPFCDATTPPTDTSWTGRCVCPKRRRVVRDPLVHFACLLGDLLDTEPDLS